VIEVGELTVEVIEAAAVEAEVIEAEVIEAAAVEAEVIELSAGSRRIEANRTESGYFEALSRLHIRESKSPGMITPGKLPRLYGSLCKPLPTRFPLPRV
jgi:hypothetical protein